ncbi:TetR/AcrR family transcriptional regulator [uncultured Friedmanniella sp.]|uniref:TetR/AcrR family transcriptional regulator n=1 Tax=uncultured Friedmanniella sp. TaxID=335381 RepID=UPI0035CB0112
MSAAGDRRAEARARIVAVAAQLLHQEGPSEVTTRRVAERAGVQAPTIYRLFDDKDGLLEAVAEHVMAGYVAAKSKLAAAASEAAVDPVADLRAAWRTQVEFGLDNPGLFRLLSDPDRVRHSAAALEGRRLLQARVHRIAETGRLRVSEKRAGDLIHAAAVGVVQTTLATPLEMRDPGLADGMVDAVLGQILLDPPAHPVDSSLATAVALRAVGPRLEGLTGAERELLGEWLDRVVDAT